MENKKGRLLYIDNIRLLVIVLVVIQHLAVTYSGYGSWYYKEGRPIGFLAQALFGFYQSLTQGYFMGLLFLLAGYFVPAAYDRKGFSRFVGDRLVRLGIPTLIYSIAVYPLTEYLILGHHAAGETFLAYCWRNLSSFAFLGNTGPLWFALALLVFSVIYGLARLIAGQRKTAACRIAVGWRTVIALMLVIAALAFLIRIVQPIGTSVFNMMLCNFAQYIVLFIMGIAAYRHDLFAKLDYSMGIRLLIWAVSCGFGAWSLLMFAGGAMAGDMTALNGGLTWQSAAFSLWESFTAVAMDIGLIVLFRERFNMQGLFVKALSGNAFAVYVFHTPIIVAAAVLFAPVQWLPGVKFLLTMVVCVPPCFAAAHFIRKVPLLNKVL